MLKKKKRGPKRAQAGIKFTFAPEAEIFWRTYWKELGGKRPLWGHSEEP